jgi:serine protease Do
VDSVEGAAARSGLREGDIVLAIENTEINNAKQFEQLVAKVDRTKPVTLLVRRGESANFIIVRPARTN